MNKRVIQIVAIPKGETLSLAKDLLETQLDSAQDSLLASGVSNLPSWANTPQAFWDRVDEAERVNGAAGKLISLTPPPELSVEQTETVTKQFIKEELDVKPVLYAIRGDANAAEPKVMRVQLLASDRVRDGIPRDEVKFFRRFRKSCPGFSGSQKDGVGRVRGQLSRRDLTPNQNWVRLCARAVSASSAPSEPAEPLAKTSTTSNVAKTSASTGKRKKAK